MKKEKILRKLGFQTSKLHKDAVKNSLMTIKNDDLPKENLYKFWQSFRERILHSSHYTKYKLAEDILCIVIQFRKFNCMLPVQKNESQLIS